jgi:hypothetical protein
MALPALEPMATASTKGTRGAPVRWQSIITKGVASRHTASLTSSAESTPEPTVTRYSRGTGRRVQPRTRAAARPKKPACSSAAASIIMPASSAIVPCSTAARASSGGSPRGPASAPRATMAQAPINATEGLPTGRSWSRRALIAA